MDETSPAERWLPIPGWEGWYEASDRGRVRSVDRDVIAVNGLTRRCKGKLLRPKLAGSKQPRIMVGLSSPRYRRAYYVHRLVLAAFVGPCPPDMEGCHNDGNPANNWLTNLRWDTSSSNNLDKAEHGTDPNRNKAACPLGHLLAPPNLRPASLKAGSRGCLACERARGVQRNAVATGRPFDFVATANRYYAEIMAGTDRASRRGRECPCGHRLVEPNLVRSALARGKLRCRACALAATHARKTELRRGVTLNRRKLADVKYRTIMGDQWLTERSA